MERISAFMDGELEDHEAAGQVRRLKEDPELRAAWETYHLIGDAMRGEAGYSPGLVVKIGARLAAEPTILAPRPRMQLRNVRRLVLSAAASIGGVALVVWLALFDNPFAPQQDLAVNQVPLAAQTQLAATPANGAVNDYLLAHQQFSPSTAMQGVASYVRTVSGQNPEQH
ncbi:MAG TPA: sigma-E factor negative regulatory protein [Terriglobales bacterium]|jgi:sigma-E factor negative regulatory protein RseA|nr:sigma-E factor negative regulatory protein [Terriglobales bacterium]